MNRTNTMTGGRSKRDVRLLALGVVALAVILLGLIIEFSGGTRTSVWQAALDAVSPPVPQPERLLRPQLEEAKQRFQQGVVMLHSKQYEHALTAFHRVLALDPGSADAYVNSGYALIGLQRHREAIDFFNGATEINPNQLNAYFGLAVAYEAHGDLEAAVGAMRTYAHLASPDDPFRRKAWAALWEWESRLKVQRGEAPPSPAGGQPPSRQN